MNRTTLGFVLAGSIAGALAAATLPASAAPPEGQEACYGVALKGHNNCAAPGHNCAGMAMKSYSATDFKFVPVGTCVKMHPHGHKGSLTPA